MTSDRLRSGHPALDEVLGGGLPAHGISMIMGLPGAGKTIMAQQYLFSNARPDRPAVYFSTISEPLEKIIRFGQSLSFFDPTAVGTSVFYEDLGQVGTRSGLAGVSEQVAAVLKRRLPGLIVIDSFKALHALAHGDADFRTFLHGLAGRLTAFPAASLWVGEYEPEEVPVCPEFAVADAIIDLAAVQLGQREMRSLHVRKLRGSGFLAGQHGYRLTADGLHLFPRLADVPARSSYRFAGERVSTGMPGLDVILNGGLLPGSNTLVAGPSGSGKTLMALHFVHGGARHGERGIIATLQENPSQLGGLLTRLGWPPGGEAAEVMYRSPVDIYIDEWVHDLLQAVERTHATRVAIDSLNDLQLASPDDTRFREFMYSLAQRFSRQGITLLSTYETSGASGNGAFSAFALTHLSDNAIMLHHDPGHAAATRSLAVVKTRASGHDPARRQFTIGPGGITFSEAGAYGPDRTAGPG